MATNTHKVIDFSELNKFDEEIIGKSAHELGRLISLNIPISVGFVILPFSELSDDLIKEIHKNYKKLSMLSDASVNIFSSTSNSKSILFSNIKGDSNLLLKIKAILKLLSGEQFAIVVQKNIKPQIKGKTSTDNPTIDKILTKQQIHELIRYCLLVQKHFYFPYEIEYGVWKNKIIITKVSSFTGAVNELIKLIPQKNTRSNILAVGISVNPGIATGRVKIFNIKQRNTELKKGEIIVMSNFDPFLFMKIKNAKGIIADSILPNSLDKTLYRKRFNMPTIEGVKNATKIFRNGNVVTINGMNGEIYSGGLI